MTVVAVIQKARGFFSAVESLCAFSSAESPSSSPLPFLKTQLNLPFHPSFTGTVAAPAIPAPATPDKTIPLKAAPPIVALWHQANRLPASTSPIEARQAAAVEPATGPVAAKPIVPRTGTVTKETSRVAPPSV